MTLTLSPEELRRYRRAALAREAAIQQKTAERRAQAWRIAHAAALRLKSDFGAKRVVVFGSLAHAAWFNSRSDIDLAVEGIAPEAFWRAWCALDDLAAGLEIDLLPWESLPPRLKETITTDGVEV
jgi:predicted nucleotidyltransferase